MPTRNFEAEYKHATKQQIITIRKSEAFTERVAQVLRIIIVLGLPERNEGYNICRAFKLATDGGASRAVIDRRKVWSFGSRRKRRQKRIKIKSRV